MVVDEFMQAVIWPDIQTWAKVARPTETLIEAKYPSPDDSRYPHQKGSITVVVYFSNRKEILFLTPEKDDKYFLESPFCDSLIDPL